MVNRDDRGLALLLVVSLMALVTLLVVSLAVITRVETQVGSIQATQNHARQNAQLALNVALGQLQELAGSDRRVTATAEATGQTNNRHWTGVWRSDDTGTTPWAWLVSGEGSAPSAESTPGRERIELVSESATDPMTQVVAPLRILAESGVARGGFAYFVADEGVKARLMPALDTPTATDLPTQRKPILGGTRPPGFAAEAGVNAWDASFQSRLEILSSRDQFSALGEGIDRDVTQTYWHDYTAWSEGVLADVVRGELKTDLTDAGDTAIAGLGAFNDLMTEERANALSPVYPIRAGSVTATGAIYDGIHPIITQVGLQFSVHTISSSSRTLETRLRFFIELTNPYSSALAAEDLRVVMSGLPDSLDIESRTTGTTRNHGGATLSLEPLYAMHTDSQGAPAIEFDLPFAESNWAPGRVITWRNQSGNTMGEGANRELAFDASTRTSYWRERPGVGLDGPDSLLNSSELRFTGSEDWNLRVEVQRANGETLQTAILPDFAAVDSAWRDANSTLPDFGIQVRLVDRILSQDGNGASAWITENLPSDFRRAELAEDFWEPTIDLESASYNVSFSAPNSGLEARQLFNRDPVERTYLSYYQPSFNSDVALFELPRQEWRSVGGLQHLPFVEGRIYNLGNSWSGRNDWFDRYYFSDPEEDAETALTSTQSGMFNLNSVRESAWEAILRGLGTGGRDYSFSATTHDADSEIAGNAIETVSTPVARLGQSAGEVWELSPAANNFQSVLRQYRRGLRGLTATQVSGLAEQIARNVRRRVSAQGPYRSVESFLAPDALFAGGNVLEYSISEYDDSVVASERINWDQYFPNAPMKMDTAAPGFITSADLMTALAPVANVRSDTFVIRAYGERVDPVTLGEYANSEPKARAWLEAVVQRFPEGVVASDFADVDTGDWSQMIADPKLGRRFRVIAFRWLNEDDL